MKYTLVEHKDPILKKVLEEVEIKPDETREIADHLTDLMYAEDGLGLAANQVGLDMRMFVLRAFQSEQTKDVAHTAGGRAMALINPKIVDVSEETVVLEEGCLSYPGLYVKIKRPKHIKIRFTDFNNRTHTLKFTGITARAIQHEMDHLDGIVHIDRANRYHRELALKRWKKQWNHLPTKSPSETSTSTDSPTGSGQLPM